MKHPLIGGGERGAYLPDHQPNLEDLADLDFLKKSLVRKNLLKEMTHKILKNTLPPEDHCLLKKCNSKE